MNHVSQSLPSTRRFSKHLVPMPIRTYPVQTRMAWGILPEGLNKKGYHLDERIRSPNLDEAPLATSTALAAVGKVRFGKANMQLLAIFDRTMLATGKIRSQSYRVKRTSPKDFNFVVPSRGYFKLAARIALKKTQRFSTKSTPWDALGLMLWPNLNPHRGVLSSRFPPLAFLFSSPRSVHLTRAPVFFITLLCSCFLFTYPLVHI